MKVGLRQLSCSGVIGECCLSLLSKMGALTCNEIGPRSKRMARAETIAGSEGEALGLFPVALPKCEFCLSKVDDGRVHVVVLRKFNPTAQSREASLIEERWKSELQQIHQEFLSEETLQKCEAIVPELVIDEEVANPSNHKR